MEELLYTTYTNLSTWILLGIIAISLYLLGKGADILVDEAVKLSIRWGSAKISSWSYYCKFRHYNCQRLQFQYWLQLKEILYLALGNAIGSIIANTALIIV